MSQDVEPSSSAGNRVQALQKLLARRPEDPRLLFGLAIEHLKAKETERGVDLLRRYLALGDDEGNGWGRLGHALLDLDRPEEAREAFERGVQAAREHGHPTLAAELDSVLADLDEGSAT